ncbi:MAG: nucleotidyltransferase domain-containing protein [Candidatus Poribacteria bacterium]|nr:nucleotidyltransferase domain-containing protein [Candidatus Poribacteria bacterium]
MTTMTTLPPVVHEMADQIVREFHPIRVLVFGSYARGEATRHSDVDLLVVMPNGTDRRKAAIAIYSLLADHTIPSDIVVTTPDEIERRGNQVGTVLRPALREGVVLYDAA